jgi:hypothetical protein
MIRTPPIREIGAFGSDGGLCVCFARFRLSCNGSPGHSEWAELTSGVSLMTSTAYLSINFEIQEQFNSSAQVTALGQSLFIVGNGIGPLCLGPLSYVSIERPD